MKSNSLLAHKIFERLTKKKLSLSKCSSASSNVSLKPQSHCNIDIQRETLTTRCGQVKIGATLWLLVCALKLMHARSVLVQEWLRRCGTALWLDTLMTRDGCKLNPRWTPLFLLKEWSMTLMQTLISLSFSLLIAFMSPVPFLCIVVMVGASMIPLMLMEEMKMVVTPAATATRAMDPTPSKATTMKTTIKTTMEAQLMVMLVSVVLFMITFNHFTLSHFVCEWNQNFLHQTLWQQQHKSADHFWWKQWLCFGKTDDVVHAASTSTEWQPPRCGNSVCAHVHCVWIDCGDTWRCPAFHLQLHACLLLFSLPSFHFYNNHLLAVVLFHHLCIQRQLQPFHLEQALVQHIFCRLSNHAIH